MDTHYLVFPSRARYWFKWEQLPSLFLKPENYRLDVKGTNLVDMISLGYTVEADDHEFLNGPEGGGIIVLKTQFGRWFPALLLRTDCSFEKPPGFPRPTDYGISVVAPKITAEHQLRLAQMPAAPSPFFSVERIVSGGSNYAMAFGFWRKRSTSLPILTKGFLGLGMQLESLDGVPADTGEIFSKINNPNLVYTWYWINAAQGVEDIAKVASFIYFGLDLAAKASGNLVVSHLFLPHFEGGREFPSATKWHKAPTKPKRTAEDW